MNAEEFPSGVPRDATTGWHAAISGRPEDAIPGHDLFRIIAESSPVAHFILRETLPLYVNPAFEALTGYSSAEALDGRCLDLFAALLPAPAEGPTPPGPQSNLPLRSEDLIHTKDGSTKWLAVTTAAIHTAQGPVLLGTLTDITENRQREEALRLSEMRYRGVLEFAPDMIMIYDLEGTVIDVNPACARIWGVPREQAIGINVPKTFWSEEDRVRFPEILAETLRRGEYLRDIEGVRPDGRHWFAESNAKVAKVGDETFIIVIVRDVTERRQLEEQLGSALREKETLLREIHHRVKNNMQIISTLLKLQLRNAGDDQTRALFRESQNRILSMAMIHEKLYQSEGIHKIDLQDYINDLAHEVFASFGVDPGRIGLRIDVQDIALKMDTAIPCGLIIIELISNSLKHAFPEGRGGEVFIGLRSQDHGYLRLTVSDDGVGLPRHIDLARLKSLGFRLVSDLARYQLQGEMDYSVEGGTTVHVTFHER